MQPYTMVKDHRTNEESGNVDAVMNGNIDNFINAYLKWVALGENGKSRGMEKNMVTSVGGVQMCFVKEQRGNNGR